MRIFVQLLMMNYLVLAVDSRVAIINEKNFPTAFAGQKGAIPFSPTDDQIQMAEKNLMVLLNSKHPSLFKRVSTYYRQYMGLEVIADRKVIRGNFLCRVDGDRWRTEWILIKDGGDCYFNFTFDLGKSEITELSINGES